METFAENEAIKVIKNHEEELSDDDKLHYQEIRVIVELDNGEIFFINVKRKLSPIYSAETL